MILFLKLHTGPKSAPRALLVPLSACIQSATTDPDVRALSQERPTEASFAAKESARPSAEAAWFCIAREQGNRTEAELAQILEKEVARWERALADCQEAWDVMYDGAYRNAIVNVGDAEYNIHETVEQIEVALRWAGQGTHVRCLDVAAAVAAAERQQREANDKAREEYDRTRQGWMRQAGLKPT